MRKFLGFVGVASLLAGPAFAADLGTRAPVYKAPPMVPVFGWGGWYIGLNAGGHWGHDSIDSVGTPSFANPAFLAGTTAVAGGLAGLGTYSSNNNNNGFIGGAQIGYNWQFNSWVAGLEADIQGLTHNNNVNGQGVVVPLVGFPEHYTGIQSADGQVDWLGTVRGRIGFLAAPTLLAYGTGGLAYGGAKSAAAVAAQESLGPATYPPVFGGIDLSETRVGWTIGGGLEWMFAPNWSLKGEYLYYDLGHKDGSYELVQTCNACFSGGGVAQPPGTVWGAANVNVHSHLNGNIARVGINYHF